MNELSLAFRDVKVSDARVNSVLRNTYWLLSVCFLACAATATLGHALNWSGPNLLLTIIGMYGLLFAVNMTANSSMGILAAIMFSAFMGYSLAPVITIYSHFAQGYAILSTAFATTGIVFLCLSGYVLNSKQDFSFMGGMIMVTFLVAFALSLLNFLIGGLNGISLIFSALVALASSASVLFHTSMIINGGERNYILATVSLFISLYNLFMSLLQLLTLFSGSNRD